MDCSSIEKAEPMLETNKIRTRIFKLIIINFQNHFQPFIFR